MEKYAAILPAAGSGSRMKLDHPKQFHILAEKPILIHTVSAFLDCPEIGKIVIAVPPTEITTVEGMLTQHLPESAARNGSVKILVVAGGRRRQDSVLEAVRAAGDDIDIVLVHDAARPMVTKELIQRCMAEAKSSGAAIAAIPVKDTLKRAATDSSIAETVDRSAMWQAQTPQAVRRQLLLEAYEKNGDRDVTDEASLLERLGIPVKLVEGSETNFKITRPEDLVMAEKLLPARNPSIRIGHGYDAHRFAAGRPLVLGGVTIDHDHGLAGHSDADVLTHALSDAILGALGEGDIGRHFPDTDQEFENIYSIRLLEQVIALTHARGYRLGNADITVVCQRPKLAPYLQEMRSLLAQSCKCRQAAINIKATTTEKMGFTGRQEGIGCHAVVLLQG